MDKLTNYYINLWACYGEKFLFIEATIVTERKEE